MRQCGSVQSYPCSSPIVLVGRHDLAVDVRRADVLGARDVVAALAALIREVVQECVWRFYLKWIRENLR